MRHPRDPAAAHVAAAGFGRLQARQLLDAGEAEAVLCQAAARAAGVDRSGLRARLLHTLADSHADWLARRRRAVARVRQAVTPLLAAWAAAAAVRRAAAAAAGAELEPGEADAIAADLAAAMLRRSA